MTTDEALLGALVLGIDRNGPVPLYHQLARSLEVAIRAGQVPVGTVLLNEIELGTRLHLSRGTVRRAIRELVDKGLLERRRGAGTRILDPAK